MKALLIGCSKEQLNKLQKNPLCGSIEFIFPDDIHHLKQLVSLDGPFGMFVVSTGMGSVEVALLLNEIKDKTGVRPVFFIGDDINFGKFKKNLKPVHPFTQSAPNLDSNAFTLGMDKMLTQILNEASPDLENYVQVPAGELKLFGEINCQSYRLLPDQRLEAMAELSDFQSSELAYLRKEDYSGLLMWALKKDGNSLIENISITGAFTNCQLRSIFLLHHYARTVGITDSLQKFTKVLIQSIIENGKRANHLLEILETFPTGLAGTSVQLLIAAYAANLMASELEYPEHKISNLLFAIIMADIGLESPSLHQAETLRDSCLAGCSEEQVLAFIDHPKQSAELSKKFNQFPDMSQLILSHHELPSRLGFPNRPDPFEIGREQSIVNLAILFARGIEGRPPKKPTMVSTINRLRQGHNIGDFKVPFKPLFDHIKYLV